MKSQISFLFCLEILVLNFDGILFKRREDI